MQRFLFLLYAIVVPVYAFAETINLDWMVDGENYAQTSCETGGNVTLPNSPIKHGYTFRGWAQNLWPGSTSMSANGASSEKTLNLPLGTYTLSAVVTLQNGTTPQLVYAYGYPSAGVNVSWRGDGARLYWVFNNVTLSAVRFYSGRDATESRNRTILFSDIWLVSGNVTAQ